MQYQVTGCGSFTALHAMVSFDEALDAGDKLVGLEECSVLGIGESTPGHQLTSIDTMASSDRTDRGVLAVVEEALHAGDKLVGLTFIKLAFRRIDKTVSFDNY
jgi:hypothetical protein